MVIIVTGANKGIGLEIVRTLYRTASKSYLCKQLGAKSVTIYLTARDETRGKEALKGLLAGGDAAENTSVEFAQLDVASKQSVADFKSRILERHKSVDVLINNAGVAPGVGGVGGTFDLKTAEWVFGINYDGVKNMTDALLPVMGEHGRVVNVSSGLGNCSRLGMTGEIVERLHGASSIADADALANDFKDAVRNGTCDAKGWTKEIYPASKMCLNALTRAYAIENKATRPNVLINYLEPGWVATDMGGQSARDGTAVDGADTPAFIAVEDIQGKSGVGFKKRVEVQWT